MIMSFKQIHDEVTRLVNAITQGGGGGGGSTVSVVSKRNTGENIADITVNNTTTQLYAPDSASDVSFDPSVKGVYTGTNTQSVVDEITDDIISLNDTISKISNTFKSVEDLQTNTDITILKNGVINFGVDFGSTTYSGYTFTLNGINVMADANLGTTSQQRGCTRCWRVFKGDVIKLSVNANTQLNKFKIYYTE